MYYVCYVSSTFWKLLGYSSEQNVRKQNNLCPTGFHLQVGRDRHAPPSKKRKRKVCMLDRERYIMEEKRLALTWNTQSHIIPSNNSTA